MNETMQPFSDARLPSTDRSCGMFVKCRLDEGLGRAWLPGPQDFDRMREPIPLCTEAECAAPKRPGIGLRLNARAAFGGYRARWSSDGVATP